MKGRPIRYSAAELAFVRENCTWPRKKLHEEFCKAFGRTDVSQGALTGLCTRRGWLTGRTGQFTTGQAPHNKGKRFNPPGSEKGWFKKGSRTGRANQMWQPIGTERIRPDGYIDRKIRDDGPMHRRWQLVHLIEWEAINGPVPEGHVLKSLDGNRRNTDPANWVAIPRRLLPHLNGGRHGRLSYDDAEPEVRPLVMALAQLRDARNMALTGDDDE